MTAVQHQTPLLEQRGQVSPLPRVHYVQHEFEVPDGTTRLNVTLRFHKLQRCQLFLSVFGPGGYRGTRMNPGAVGDIVLELSFGEGFASLGALPGVVESGTWRAQIDVENTDETAQYLLTVEHLLTEEASTEGWPADTLSAGPATSPATSDDAATSDNTATVTNGRPAAGWYRGELHSHTHHSDGKASATTVAGAARQYGLDFLALTDHFTTAGWPEITAQAGPDLAIIQSLELTGHRGHANLHGLSEWVDPFVDEPGSTWDINAVARAVHSQGGLFGVNHAFSNSLGWRYHELDWSLCDVFEIYHHLEGPNNAAQLTFWDGLLRAGHRITGVAGTDSHDPHAGRHRLGQVFTVLGADSLTPGGLLSALKAGRAYVSLGPELGFSAEAGGKTAGMGEELPLAGPVRLHIGLSELTFPVRVFVMKNGLYHTHLDLPASGERVQVDLEDSDPVSGYYRVEVYARPAQSDFFSGREWQNTLLLSNPIYTGEQP